jgi:microcystin-dependent protein
LPDLRGRLAMGQGNGVGLTPRVLGEVAGQTSNTLTLGQTPTHAHPLNVISNPTITSNTQTPAGNVLLAQTLAKVGNTTPTMNLYATDGRPAQTMAAQSVGNTGGQPHSNMQPYLAVNYCIALVGIFPSRN